ncbi:MAG: winged helix-turn-helix domain-containing protein [Bacillus sp. (in: Bacteria)]|nr:winged helix-turn-helix domain-containing protein [Bacillus sp. (in: firmicutes)]
MAQVKFHVHDYTITILGETIPLLRKEYELFHFLYENNLRPFTREKLLDAVWPTSAPSDRTVDDHIYRLRKKLAKWKDSISIDTIKGYGYQLTINDEGQASPFEKDDEFFSTGARADSKVSFIRPRVCPPILT